VTDPSLDVKEGAPTMEGRLLVEGWRGGPEGRGGEEEVGGVEWGMGKVGEEKVFPG